MVISRGLGNSIFPIRLFNSYNLPVIEVCIWKNIILFYKKC
jgi:predicted MPP superfamily phosphohydrolase